MFDSAEEHCAAEAAAMVEIHASSKQERQQVHGPDDSWLAEVPREDELSRGLDRGLEHRRQVKCHVKHVSPPARAPYICDVLESNLAHDACEHFVVHLGRAARHPCVQGRSAIRPKPLGFPGYMQAFPGWKRAACVPHVLSKLVRWVQFDKR